MSYKQIKNIVFWNAALTGVQSNAYLSEANNHETSYRMDPTEVIHRYSTDLIPNDSKKPIPDAGNQGAGNLNESS